MKDEILRKEDTVTLKHTTDNLRTTQVETDLAQLRPPLLQRTESETKDTNMSRLTHDKNIQYERPGTEIDNYQAVLCSQNHEVRLSQVMPSQNMRTSSQDASQMTQF